MSDQLTITDVGVMVLVLKVFVDFAKFAFEKVTEKRNGNTSPSQTSLSQLIREVHTSVVSPDHTPLHVKVNQLYQQLDRRRRS